ncbi:MAG: spore gernimation protein [Paenibacillus sp.]|nr:spore gernimation protein [Paenibacillus sp.]
MQEKLSPFHLTIFIYMIQTGIVVFTLPQLLAENFGTNGWLILIVISLIVSLNIGMISVVFRLGNGKSMFAIMEQSIPKALLYPFYTLLVCVWSMFGCLITKNYVLIFQMIAFPTTPPMLFKLAVDVLVFLLMIKTVYNISKAATVFFWMIIWMVSLLFFFFGDFEWARLTPFVFQNGQPSIKGFVTIFTSFLGYELSLLLMPYCDRKTKFARSVLAGNAILAFNYLFFSIVAFGFYGYESLKNLEFPLLNLLAYVQLPFIQAIENLLYGGFLFPIIITTVMYCWSAKETLQRMIPASGKLLAFLIVFLVYWISYIPEVLSEVQRWIAYLSYVELAVSFGLPAVLIVLLLVQRRKGGVADA